MDVDPPFTSNLKRSRSAPMINELFNLSPESTSQSKDSIIQPIDFSNVNTSRAAHTRRFSGSFSPNHALNSTHLTINRVNQIKHEESMDIVFQEAAHEREIKSKLQMSHSLEDLTLDDPSLNEQDRPQRSQSIDDSIHLHPPLVRLCGSPTITGRQCFSPSMCLPVPQSAFSSPSSSPTRFYRFHQSPISLKPSQLSLKRKHSEENENKEFAPSTKQQNTGLSPVIVPLSSQHHVQSLSFSLMDTTCDSFSMVPY